MLRSERRALIREVTSPVAVSGGEGLRVYAAPAPLAVWEATERASGRHEEPPFWAHPWPGGLALAQWVLRRPELVRGKRVLDFAAGGGVTSLAAMHAGAAHVVATELDEWALAAIEENAALNALSVEVSGRDVVGVSGEWDVVLVGDVFYEAELSRRIFEWLRALRAEVAIGDPGRSFLPREQLELVFTAEVRPNAAWDSVVDRPARVWRLPAP